MKPLFSQQILFSCLVLAGLVQAAPPLPGALPTGGVVSSGSASIATAGNTMTVNQSTNRAAINWDTFNVGKSSTVNFIQPNTQSATLNRVTGNSPSQIFGQIHANGQVYLLNPSGIYFAPGAMVDVNSIVATTHDLSDADFMAGKSSFSRKGSTASVVNEAQISASIGGYIALLAPEVRNNGVVIAKQGTIAMASGELITLNFGPISKLESIAVTPGDFNALVVNNHAVLAADGMVILSARAMNQLASQVIQNGTIEAKGISSQGGRIILDSGINGSTQISGLLDVTSDTSKGGRIEVLGQNVQVKSTGVLDASGSTGGGEVLVGGSWQNSDLRVSQAITTTIEAGASLRANATDYGDGGTVVAWSDVVNQNSQTTVAGNLQAKGGINGGNGGRIETSGFRVNSENAFVDASSPKGRGGLWLIDPSDATINQTIADGYANTLNTGTSVLNSVNGNIDTVTGVNISKTAGGDAAFTLQATGNIAIASGTKIESTSGKLDVVLNSNSNGGGGAVSMTGATIKTNGGTFTLGGTSNPLTGSAVGIASKITGASIDGGEITTAGGNVSIRGEGFSGSLGGAETAWNSTFGVRIGQNAVINSGGGNITIAGLTASGNPNAFSHAILFGDQGSISGGASILSGSGNIVISGNTLGGGNYSNGVYFQSSLAHPVTISASGAGSVSLTGFTSNPSTLENHGVFFEEGTQAISTQNGALSITGKGSGTNGYGIAFQHAASTNNTTIGSATQTGNIDITADSMLFVATTNATIQGAGNLTFNPLTNSTPIEFGASGPLTKLVVPSAAFGSQIADGFSQINIGSTSGSGAISTTADLTARDNLAIIGGSGPIQISNVINAGSNTLTLNSSTSITESGAGSITADKLLVLGTSGASTLQSASNSVNVLAANTGSLAYVNSGALTVGGIDFTSGVTASGPISIATANGNLTVANNISTGSTSLNAVNLIAGRDFTAGNIAGGNIAINSGAQINVGSGGAAMLYTGSYVDSTGVAQLVSSSGGSYRFNSDPNTSNFTTPLGVGINVIYRDPFAPTQAPSEGAEILSTTPPVVPIMPELGYEYIVKDSNANINTIEGVGQGAGGPGDGSGPGNGAGQGKGAPSTSLMEIPVTDPTAQTSNANINTVEGVGQGAGGPGDGSGPGNGAGQGKSAPSASPMETPVTDPTAQTSSANINTVEDVGQGAGGPGDGSGPGNGAGQGQGKGSDNTPGNNGNQSNGSGSGSNPSSTPGTSDIPSTPNAPSTPVAPANPDAPTTPNVPNTAPGTTDAPSTPNAP
ncbi:beta strand repeat-containing protein, partial [Polynucleobacter sinensis]|uniref:beta strand repeat-containing protein n=1 Tax=Polynucleobacter sinensis TaxID=1743157 RepID=UPI000781690C